MYFGGGRLFDLWGVSMNLFESLRLVISPIVLTAVGEFLLKSMMNREVAEAWHVLGHAGTWGAFILILLGGITWLYAMSKVSLSFMYPFMGLNYIVIIFGSDFGLHEPVTWHRYIAVAFIVMGLFLVSRSPNISAD